MMLIPLETMVINGNVEIPIDILLDPSKTYEMAIYNLITSDVIPYGVHSIKCNILDPTVCNPNQILYSFTDQVEQKRIEYFKIDTYNLRTLSLCLTTAPEASLTITLAIREYEDEKQTIFC